MARTLLISCNVTREPYPVFPLGMTMVAEGARQAGHSVRLWDLNLGEEGQEPLGKVVADFKPQAIGLSLRNIDNFNYTDQECYAPAYKNLVAALRGMTGAPVVLGGAAFSLFAPALMQTTGADYGVVGEGEALFADFLNGLDAGLMPPKGLIGPAPYRSGASIFSPQRDPVLAAYYLKQGGMLNLQTKRGCPLACAYCSYPTLEGGQYRFRSPKALADEMEMLKKTHGCDYIAMVDSVFNDTQGVWLEIAEELARRDLGVPWMAFFRPMHFKPQDVALLKRAGCASVEFGSDCSTDATLAGMHKSFSWAEVAESTELFNAQNISTSQFIIFGGPGETHATVQEGLENISRLQNTVVFACAGVRVIPRTLVHQLALAQGQVKAEDPLLDPKYYFAPGIDPQRMHAQLLEGFAGRKDRIYPPTQDLAKIEAFHALGYRGPVWDMLLGRRESRRKRG
jgi:hypothetical protein